MFDVGGGAMYLRCTGTAAPTVVFDSALGMGADEWNAIAPSIARTARVCVYDRKGVGRSAPPGREPHSPHAMADELHALLARASIGGPYVLVGHSIGGITMRLFAAAHPDEVAGVVLVEAADDPMVLWALMPKSAVDARRAELDRSPEGLDLDTFVAAAREMHATSTSLGDKPLVILSRGKPDAPPTASPEVARQWLARWDAQQAELPTLAPGAVRVVAPTSGHMMQHDAPALIIAAVEEVVHVVQHRQTRPRADAIRA
ncbi:MAG TPA: alpha/beta fold hydrolase [Kofleriaceae bacterium]